MAQEDIMGAMAEYESAMRVQVRARVRYYLSCLRCQHRFESQYRDIRCPDCRGETRTYGLQELTTREEASARLPEAS